MPTTVELPESLYRRAESVATELGLSVGEYMARLVEQGLPVPEAGKVRYGQEGPIPVVIPAAGRHFPPMTNVDIFEWYAEEGR